MSQYGNKKDWSMGVLASGSERVLEPCGPGEIAAKLGSRRRIRPFLKTRVHLA